MSATPITDAFEDRVVNGTETRAPLVRPLTNTIDYCAAYGEAIEQMEELELELQAVKVERGELALKLAGAQCYIEEQKKLSAAPAEGVAIADEIDGALGDATILRLFRQHRAEIVAALRGRGVSASALKRPDCPHAAPHRFCQECVVSPCPIGLGK